MILARVSYILLLIVLYTAVFVSATIVCESRPAAVALVQAVCALDAQCRAAVHVIPPDTAAGWDALLVDETQLLVPDNVTLPPPDLIRQILWPTAPAWRAAPLIAWAVAGLPNTGCAALAAGPIAAASPLPLELMTLLYALEVHQAVLARTNRCDDTNEVPVYDPLTGNITCDCAPDKDCRPPPVFDVVAGLLWAVAIAAAIVVAALALYVIISSAVTMQRLHALQRAQARGAPLLEMSMLRSDDDE